MTVDLTTTGPAVSDQLLGMNMAAWYDVVTNDTGIVNAYQTAGIKAVRWPGGSWSDAYNWETNTECGSTANGNDSFTNFVNDIVIPAGLDVALTADYGTGKNCTGPGDPTEAAAWVTAALTDGITVSHMTVGNEEYGSWETDLHYPEEQRRHLRRRGGGNHRLLCVDQGGLSEHAGRRGCGAQLTASLGSGCVCRRAL